MRRQRPQQSLTFKQPRNRHNSNRERSASPARSRRTDIERHHHPPSPQAPSEQDEDEDEDENMNEEEENNDEEEEEEKEDELCDAVSEADDQRKQTRIIKARVAKVTAALRESRKMQRQVSYFTEFTFSPCF